MIYTRRNLAQAEGGTPSEAPLTRDWSPWIIGGAIVLSGLIAMLAAAKGNRR